MRITPKTPAHEIYQRAYHLYQFRIITILFLIILYALTIKIGHFDINPWPLYLVIFVEVFINRPYRILFRNSNVGFNALVASVAIDFLTETTALHLLGNVDLFIYSSCFFISIVYCALNLPTVLTFQFATLASFLYAGFIVAGHFGILPRTISFGPNLSMVQEIAIIVRHIAFFYLIAFFIRTLSAALTKKEEQLESFVWELRETSDKIKYTYHLQTEYFARMSHEIRAPLNSILGFSELLIENKNEPATPKQKDFLSRIHRSAQHLRDLINDVLDLSKMESKKMKLNPQEIDLVRVINTVLEVFYEEAIQKRILLSFYEKPASLKVMADELKVRQVLYNLLSNALKFTQQGFVRIHLEKEKESAKIIVEDSGPGIALENLKVIFSPYEQAGRATAKTIKGTGLGLAISKQFVEMHGGNLWAESKLGKGSFFIVRLPYKLPEPKPEASDTPVPADENPAF